MTDARPVPFDNSYARLPGALFARQLPERMPDPRLLRLNGPLAEQLGLDPAWLRSPAGIAFLSGQEMPAGAEPLAMAYAGHQFGHFVPLLGDGRAMLLGEVIDRDGVRRDIHLKGSGRTPFSRRGDGRAALGPVLREYVVSEAMAALGVPTTRALAAVATGEQVRRERSLPGAILVRVAQSHIRIGTFELFAARGDHALVQVLADHVIARHYPECQAEESPYGALLNAVIARQAGLVARWMGLGFIHGVMNTDNMTLSGETIDYGPCAFMDTYHPETVYSAIDHAGRYAYLNQPRIAAWNLSRLAEALLPLLGAAPEAGIERAQAAIDAFPARYEEAWLHVVRPKLGLTAPHAGDRALADELLALMATHQADWTQTFRRLAELAAPGADESAFRALLGGPGPSAGWLASWRARLAAEPEADADRADRMARANPAIIPRNHLVEEAIAAAVETGDLAPFHALVEALAHPFEPRSADDRFTLPPRPDQVVHQTFCGT